MHSLEYSHYVCQDQISLKNKINARILTELNWQLENIASTCISRVT